MKFEDAVELSEKKKSDFEKLKDNKVKLTPEERAECIKKKAVWNRHYGTGPNPNVHVECAVWKSVHPETGKTTYITHTHRAYNTAPTLKGAIGRFHKFIKGTA